MTIDTFTLDTWQVVLLIVVVVLELVLKAWALWRAARSSHVAWFVILTVINSAGILPIIYLLLHRSDYHDAR